MKKILVTGGAGFIGSNFVRHMLATYSDLEIVNIDALTYAGNLMNLSDQEGHARHRFIKLDITDREAVDRVIGAEKVDALVHFAAESHVDRSIHFGVQAFIDTNICGTQNLLDAARKYEVPRYLQVSTDEVYGSLGEQGRFTEQSPVQPRNPYAATKASADFLVQAAANTYGMDTVITRCSNNFGPYQFPEKLIPLMIANALEDKALPVYGDGLHVRDWIYVLDHCSAIDAALRKGASGQVYNIGGMYDVPNIEIVKQVLALLNKSESLITYVKDRPGHDRRYAMDNHYIEKELGWTPAHSFKDALQETIDWYLGHGDWLENLRSGKYQSYYEKLYADR